MTMSALSVYLSTARVVFSSRARVGYEQALYDINRRIPQLRQMLSCVVCRQLLTDPYAPKDGRCHHNVCRLCIRGQKQLHPKCAKCKDCRDFKTYDESRQVHHLLVCYKSLCQHIQALKIFEQLSHRRPTQPLDFMPPCIKLPNMSTQEFIIEGSQYVDVLSIFTNDLPRAPFASQFMPTRSFPKIHSERLATINEAMEMEMLNASTVEDTAIEPTKEIQAFQPTNYERYNDSVRTKYSSTKTENDPLAKAKKHVAATKVSIPTVAKNPSVEPTKVSTSTTSKNPSKATTKVSMPTTAKNPSVAESEVSMPTVAKNPTVAATKVSTSTTSKNPSKATTKVSTSTTSKNPSKATTKVSMPTTANKPSVAESEVSMPTVAKNPTVAVTKVSKSISAKNPSEATTKVSMPTTSKNSSVAESLVSKPTVAKNSTEAATKVSKSTIAKNTSEAPTKVAVPTAAKNPSVAAAKVSMPNVANNASVVEAEVSMPTVAKNLPEASTKVSLPTVVKKSTVAAADVPVTTVAKNPSVAAAEVSIPTVAKNPSVGVAEVLMPTVAKNPSVTDAEVSMPTVATAEVSMPTVASRPTISYVSKSETKSELKPTATNLNKTLPIAKSSPTSSDISVSTDTIAEQYTDVTETTRTAAAVVETKAPQSTIEKTSPVAAKVSTIPGAPTKLRAEAAKTPVTKSEHTLPANPKQWKHLVDLSAAVQLPDVAEAATKSKAYFAKNNKMRTSMGSKSSVSQAPYSIPSPQLPINKRQLRMETQNETPTTMQLLSNLPSSLNVSLIPAKTIDADVRASKPTTVLPTSQHNTIIPVSNPTTTYSLQYSDVANNITFKRKRDSTENGTSDANVPLRKRPNIVSSASISTDTIVTPSSQLPFQPIPQKTSSSKQFCCRCGTSPSARGLLTCCGQRCPCYVARTPCQTCKCRGCKNPHRFEAGTVDTVNVPNTVQSGSVGYQGTVDTVVVPKTVQSVSVGYQGTVDTVVVSKTVRSGSVGYQGTVDTVVVPKTVRSGSLGYQSAVDTVVVPKTVRSGSVGYQSTVDTVVVSETVRSSSVDYQDDEMSDDNNVLPRTSHITTQTIMQTTVEQQHEPQLEQLSPTAGATLIPMHNFHQLSNVMPEQQQTQTVLIQDENGDYQELNLILTDEAMEQFTTLQHIQTISTTQTSTSSRTSSTTAEIPLHQLHEQLNHHNLITFHPNESSSSNSSTADNETTITFSPITIIETTPTHVYSSEDFMTQAGESSGSNVTLATSSSPFCTVIEESTIGSHHYQSLVDVISDSNDMLSLHSDDYTIFF